MTQESKVRADGIIDFSTSTASVLSGFGISRVSLIGQGQVEVAFSDSDYKSLQSGVMVCARNSLPRFIAWDSYGNDSVRVRIWLPDETAVPAGSFSVTMCVHK